MIRFAKILNGVIRTAAAAFQWRTALDIEVEAHDAFARNRARHFLGRKDILGSIDDESVLFYLSAKSFDSVNFPRAVRE
jgi:hypothetical protein